MNPKTCEEVRAFAAQFEAVAAQIEPIQARCTMIAQVAAAMETAQAEEKQAAAAHAAQAKQEAAAATAAAATAQAAAAAEAQAQAQAQAALVVKQQQEAAAAAAAKAAAAKVVAEKAAADAAAAAAVAVAEAASAAAAVAAMDVTADPVQVGFTVTIKFVGTADTLSVTVPSNASTVLELKEAVQRLRPTAPAARQMLIAKGRQLTDTMTLSDARLVAGAVVRVARFCVEVEGEGMCVCSWCVVEIHTCLLGGSHHACNPTACFSGAPFLTNTTILPMPQH
jgi:SWI/SNF-related matrix-associated actin-dependent regulator 1 of chromatin subfamily A